MNRFLCTTPNGGDYISCPNCNNYCRTTLAYSEKLHDECNEMSYIQDNLKYCDIIDDEEFIDENDCYEDIRYCIKCKIIFKIGSIFKELGCTDSIYNALMIESFIFKNKTFYGIPLFKSHTHWKKLLKNNKIKLKWNYCFNKNDVTFIEIAKNNKIDN